MNMLNDIVRGTLLYDIYDYDVVTIKFIEMLNNDYALCVNVEQNKPISIYNHRLISLFKTRYDALVALNDILESKQALVQYELSTYQLKNKS
jgi:hypothetical protein